MTQETWMFALMLSISFIGLPGALNMAITMRQLAKNQDELGPGLAAEALMRIGWALFVNLVANLLVAIVSLAGESRLGYVLGWLRVLSVGAVVVTVYLLMGVGRKLNENY